MINPNQSESSLFWPVGGLALFISRPRFWRGPLMTMVSAFVVMAGLFFWIIFSNWPNAQVGWLQYLWTIVKSVGYGSAAVLALWVIALPLGLTWCFEGMTRKILKEEGAEVVEESLIHSLRSGLTVLFRTLGWRIFWPIFALICTFTLGPIGVIVGHIGLGHIAAIDATDLSLSLLGYKGSERIEQIRQRRTAIFFSGVVAGALGFLLGLTVIAWLFWMPGVFAGAPLWVKTWASSKKR